MNLLSPLKAELEIGAILHRDLVLTIFFYFKCTCSLDAPSKGFQLGLNHWNKTELPSGVTSDKIWVYKTDIPHVAQDCELELHQPHVVSPIVPDLVTTSGREQKGSEPVHYALCLPLKGSKPEISALRSQDPLYLNRSNIGLIKAVN